MTKILLKTKMLKHVPNGSFIFYNDFLIIIRSVYK
jgi:hypothetical protein